MPRFIPVNVTLGNGFTYKIIHRFVPVESFTCYVNHKMILFQSFLFDFELNGNPLDL